ncbi:fumarylacetoacetate hydrolase family protein [Azospirillum canadense]|uniref:fumarylacetoacetate hydrolase family protein n=1 Tax=Azospirillum canadense TaxID=403962 RepID=UPI0022268975|nr:fumarylacetoacetate hydrolase family protein [Azospirillum canadense]MCW2242642.1 ureidoglycolate lyase [Azospirillum canadense]
MKLLRFGPAGHERPGLLDGNGVVRDLSGIVADIDPSTLTDEGLARLRALDPERLAAVPEGARLGPCVAGVSKVVCVGLNYRAHAAESGMAEPAEPVLFMKATTSICGPNDPVIAPKGSTKLDWEVELGIVIGKTARYVEKADVFDHIAGYCVVNDVSERAFQIESTGQWVKGKSADTFCPVGPWMATRDEIPDPQALRLWLEVDGKRWQDSTTGDMIFTVADIVSYISRFMTLLPGDIIATGTPQGVALGQNPQPWLKPGQTMRLGVEGLGEQRQTVQAYEG